MKIIQLYNFLHTFGVSACVLMHVWCLCVCVCVCICINTNDHRWTDEMSQVQGEGSHIVARTFGESWKNFSDTSDIEAFMIEDISELTSPQ